MVSWGCQGSIAVVVGGPRVDSVVVVPDGRGRERERSEDITLMGQQSDYMEHLIGCCANNVYGSAVNKLISLFNYSHSYSQELSN